MPQKSGSSNIRSCFLTRESLFNLQLARIYAFDLISHGTAADILETRPIETAGDSPPAIFDGTRQYYSQAVVLPHQAAAFYGVPETAINAVIVSNKDELREDGMLALQGNAYWDAVKHLGVRPPGSEFILLPPRAVLKLALFLPATPAVVATVDALWDFILGLGGDKSTAEDWQRTSDRRRLRCGKRIANSKMVANQQKAKELGLLAYVHHFGHHLSGNTWTRLFDYKGEFPPPRGDLWVSRIATVKKSDSNQ
jgi:hypothetical protein